MSKEHIQSLFDQFAQTSESAVRVSALSELMTLKALPKRSDDPRFDQGMGHWIATANTLQAEASERLLAIAEVIRATQQLKKTKQPELFKRLHPAFQIELPPLHLLEDPEARLNVARACSMLDVPWVQRYRAVSIASETSSKTRAEMMAGLVGNAASIVDVLDSLTKPFEEVQPETENPADSLARRLKGTLEVFRSTVLASLIDAGEDVGLTLDRFIRNTMASTGRPKDESVQFELTREVALTLHDLVRSRFSLATEPKTLLALQYCRSFFSGASWPKEVQGEMNLLVQDVSEALVMLGRMGIPNQDLLNRLELVCGLKERARYVANSLADTHPEMDEVIRTWLRTGRLITTVNSSNVLQEAAGDGYLDLMRDGCLRVVLTGGGADLPMIQNLAHGVVEIRGRRIECKPMPHVPTWINESYPQFAPQYPQLAVAIGGANPELPVMAESFADFKGLGSPTYTA